MNLGFLKIESFKRGILFSSAFNFLAKLLLFLQSIVIAYYFGTQAKTDIYFYCIATVTLVCVFINSLDTSILIPESMRLKEQESKEKSVDFLNFFIYCYVIIGTVFTAILLIFPVEIFGLFSKFDIHILRENRELLLMSMPLFVLMATTNLLVNILTSYKYFTIPMMLAVINSSLVLIFLFLFHNSLSMQSVLAGQLVAYSLNILFLVTLMRRGLQWNFSFPGMNVSRRVFKNIAFAQVGSLTTLMLSYVPMYLMTGFGGGVITALTYGQKTSEMPNQLITMQVSSVAAIKFNELYARDEYGKLNDVFSSTIKTLLFIMVPISVVTFLYARDIISIFYERGSFDANSVSSSYLFLKFFVLLLPLLAVNTLATRLIIASQLIGYSVVYQVALNVVMIGLVWLGVRYFGPMGYPYGSVAGYAISVFALTILLRKLPFISYGKILRYFIKTVALNVIVALGVYWLTVDLFQGHFLKVFVATALYFGLIVALNLVLKLDQGINDIIRSVLKRFGF
jgi:putative peptidoglycan lipid II flippase